MDRVTAAQLKSLKESGLRVLTGTIASGSSDATNMYVRLDNNADPAQISQPVFIPSICGPMLVGTRVAVLVTPPSGMLVIGFLDGMTSIPNRDANEFSIVRNSYTGVGANVWTKPIDQRFYAVIVRVQGGGGGSGGTAANGGGAASSCSGGGQGGNYAEVYIRAQDLTDTCTANVGAGGAAAAAGNNNGGTGGASSFVDNLAVNYVSAPGGVGGAGGGVSGGGQTTQDGGSGAQTPTVDTTRAVLLDLQQGDDGLQGFRYEADPTGIIMPGSGGGSRLSGITRVGTRSAGQIAPTTGYLFGGGASGRGVDLPGAFGAGGGAAGAQGIVFVYDLYRV